MRKRKSMGEDTSKPKVEQSDSEVFDIAVRRDDTVSLDEIAKSDESGDGNTDDSQASTDDEASFNEEKEITSATTDDLPPSSDTPTGVDSFAFNDAPSEPVSPPVQAEPTVNSQPIAPVTPVAVDVAPANVATPVSQIEQHTNTPGSLVLQWLSYAFWGWFGTSLAVLSGITFGYFIAGSDATSWGDNLAYPLAAVIVMLVIALVTDFFYARHEPVAKRGAASVIMLIHVVIYMLVVVGALIGIVFSIISMIITAGPTDTMDGSKIFMLTALLTAVVFGAISVRALFAGKKAGVRKMFWLAMSVLALGFVVASIAGPAMKANSTKNDRLIEDALPSLASDIREYTRTNDKLPATLADVKNVYGDSVNGQVQQMVDRNLVTYKPNTKPMETASDLPLTSGASTETKSTLAPIDRSTGTKTFYYQLCVTYKEAKSSKYDTYNTSSYDNDYTNSSISTYRHDKGNVCYDVAADGKYSYADY